MESKDGFGESLLTLVEKQEYMKLCISLELAQHYENISQHYVALALENKSKFWNFIRGGRKLPNKPFTMTVTEDLQRLIVKPAKMVDVTLARVPRGEEEGFGKRIKTKGVVRR
jgi:hypothetical protein